MPGPINSKDVGYFDVSDWGEKDVEGAYPPGTMTDLGDGELDLSTLPDVIGGGGEAAPEKRSGEKPKPRAPGTDGAPPAK